MMQVAITDEWINQTWYVHTMEHCSALERNEILIRTTMWINPENIMLNEINQTQRDEHCMILIDERYHPSKDPMADLMV